MLRSFRLHAPFAPFLFSLCSFSMVVALQSRAAAQSAPPTQIWQVGLEITGGDRPATGVVATVPIPDDWPEQQVKIVKQEKTRDVRRISFRDLGGARQMVLSIPRLAAGASAKALITFEVTRRFAEAPPEADKFQAAKGLSRDLRAFLKPSPMIESTDQRIRDLAQEIIAGKATAWKQTKAIFQWVRENVDYREGQRGAIAAPDGSYHWIPANAVYREGDLKGALAALNDRNGDCEEFASLFIALCRASEIPARTVWVPGHCYCEFYLQDAQGKGQWISCDATRDYPFGSVYEPRVILQKGDNFYNSAQRKWMRYPVPTLRASDFRGRAGPKIKPILRQVTKSGRESNDD